MAKAPKVEPGDVATYLGLQSVAGDESVQKCCDAVSALAVRWIDSNRWNGADVRQGLVMLAARLWRRRNSPAGVESIGELGAVYVSRNDPDLAMLLGLGNYKEPFAL